MSVFIDSPEIRERTFAENELCFAFLSNIPITPGHTLIAPKREVTSIAELTEAEFLAVKQLTEVVASRLEDVLDAQGFNFAWNQGENFGQSVPHFHLHVVPRTSGDSGITNYDPRTFLYRPGSREVSPESELTVVASLLREKG